MDLAEQKKEASGNKIRHILSLSGGKDSSALAVYMRDREVWRRRLNKVSEITVEEVEMEYVFCDTQKELPETYEYLSKLEAYLGKPIKNLNADRGFDHYLNVYQNFLPSPTVRWCTRMLKLKPFEDYIGDDPVYSYIGIRGDEDRGDVLAYKPNITRVYPFKEDGITRDDVFQILEQSGLSVPEYYKWRTRSGCYFCFFQRKAEWVGLLERHPEMFEEAKKYEKFNEQTGRRYTWSQSESLEELSQPERVEEIKAKHNKTVQIERKARPNRPLAEVLADAFDDEDDLTGCVICHV
jgi:3'-phosphoadenosine 5'-phosphosulfate sulfotransferase (PAPS reductase)/FAD synthetase